MKPETLKAAMSNIGLDNRVDDLLDQLDEIELDRRLKISAEQFARGETLTVEELKKRTTEKFKNGYYTRNGK
ncbi:MAG: hypothetical protein FWF67_03495 [Fibromonadales bacterium]|nr:hypothetical protein [Fibromonadales bacterium]